ncbi:MAG: hypothetical protein QOE36_3259 [Gaiellaceae bacterium]|nr:hypothetical protein [Gaiellaceae bacterium]
MSALSARELAEDAGAWAPALPGAELIRTDRYALFLGAAPHLAFAQRLRLEPETVAATVAEVEQLAADRAHDPPSWWVSESSEPAGLGERLQELGLVPTERLKAMALEQPPAGEPTLDVRRVTSFDEFRAMLEITWEAFEVTEEKRAPMRERLPESWKARGNLDGAANYLAYDEGRPVAAGSAEFLPGGVFLAGGATLPDARGRGAYTSLVHARWHAAVERGTPLLVVQAMEDAARVLERLDFETVARIQLYERPPEAP